MSDQVIRIHDVEIGVGTEIQKRYEITRHLGSGGFAQVFEAFDTNIERPVAIKFLNLHTGTTNKDASDNILMRFKREAKLAAKIQHPNVVNIFDFGLVGQNRNIPFIVMELLSGFDLEEQIYEKGAMKAERALPLFVRCLEALGEAHKMGIVHKDLKPSNLFLSNPGERSEALRIVDFGIAHIRDAREGRLTATGEILGTPQYLSPEYIESQLVTPAFDVYQMGLILVEALTGKPVVDETHPLRCVKTHAMGELDLPTKLLDSELGPVVGRALHLDHTARFENAEEFADALAEVDISKLPVLGPDMPTSRLAEAGTLDSDSRIMNARTGQLRQPTTGQFTDNGPGRTQQGYAPAGADNGNNNGNNAISSQPTAQHAKLKQGPTNQVPRSTEAAIQNAGFGKNGIKALIILGVAVLALGGVAAWLLVTNVGDEPAASENQQAEESVAEESVAEESVAEESVAEKSTAEKSTAEKSSIEKPTSPSDEPAAAGAAASADDDEKLAEDVAPAAKAAPIEMTVDSSPGGASVWRGSEKLGQAPVSLRFASAEDEPISLRLTRRGYENTVVSVSPSAAPSLLVELKRKPRAEKPATRTTKPKRKAPAKKPTRWSKKEPPREEPPQEYPAKHEEPAKKEEPQRMLIAP